MTKAHVVILGSINVDLVTTVNALPLKGETVFGDTFLIEYGGKGANQAVAAARLGAKVSMIGRVGSDGKLSGKCDRQGCPRGRKSL